MTTRRLFVVLLVLAALNHAVGFWLGMRFEQRRAAAEEAEALAPHVVGAARP